MEDCPFCGEGIDIDEHVLHYSIDTLHYYYVMCQECKAHGPVSFKSKEHAAELWDDRL